MEFQVTIVLPESARQTLLAHAATLGTADLLSFLTDDQKLQLSAQDIVKKFNVPVAPAPSLTTLSNAGETLITVLSALTDQKPEACPVLAKATAAPVAPAVPAAPTSASAPKGSKKIEAELPIRQVTVPTRNVGEPRIDWLRRALPDFLEENPGANATQVSEWIFRDKSKKTLTATSWALRQLAADGVIVEKQGKSDLHYTLKP